MHLRIRSVKEKAYILYNTIEACGNDEADSESLNNTTLHELVGERHVAAGTMCNRVQYDKLPLCGIRN